MLVLGTRTYALDSVYARFIVNIVVDTGIRIFQTVTVIGRLDSSSHRNPVYTSQQLQNHACGGFKCRRPALVDAGRRSNPCAFAGSTQHRGARNFTLQVNPLDLRILIARFLAYLYTNQSLTVNWNGCYSYNFNISNTVNEGGILSPRLFCIYTD